MRKTRAEAAETRRRIVDTAADEFRRKGIAGAGLQDLMAAAGLTHGGFYRHFDSKEHLIAEAIESAFNSVAEAMADASGHSARSHPDAPIAAYLSTAHRDDPTFGCPLAALGSEIARADPATRAVATAGFLRLVDLLAERNGKRATSAARRRAMATVSTMVGALIMSRIVTDADLSSAILDQTVKQINRR